MFVITSQSKSGPKVLSKEHSTTLIFDRDWFGNLGGHVGGDKDHLNGRQHFSNCCWYYHRTFRHAWEGGGQSSWNLSIYVRWDSDHHWNKMGVNIKNDHCLYLRVLNTEFGSTILFNGGGSPEYLSICLWFSLLLDVGKYEYLDTGIYEESKVYSTLETQDLKCIYQHILCPSQLLLPRPVWSSSTSPGPVICHIECRMHPSLVWLGCFVSWVWGRVSYSWLMLSDQSQVVEDVAQFFGNGRWTSRSAPCARFTFKNRKLWLQMRLTVVSYCKSLMMQQWILWGKALPAPFVRLIWNICLTSLDWNCYHCFCQWASFIVGPCHQDWTNKGYL